MAQFTVNADAVRPVQELQVPGEVGRPLRRRRQQGQRRSSARPRWSSTARAATRAAAASRPGRTEYDAITLERGVTHDVDFEQWANKVWNYGSGLGAEISLKDFRKDIIIEVYNEAGQLAIAYKVYRCWVSEYQALPELDANANAVADPEHQARERGLGARLRRAASRPSRRSPSRDMAARPGSADPAVLLAAWEAGGRRPGRARSRRRCCTGPGWSRASTSGLDLPLGHAVGAGGSAVRGQLRPDAVDAVLACPACRSTSRSRCRWPRCAWRRTARTSRS